MQVKSVPQLRQGDIVKFYGGRFLILEDAFQHRPEGAHGCSGRCLEGEIEGYFFPGSLWWFQGNELSAHSIEGEGA